MPLSPGARLGPYEITAQIGAGGMGEVYRARDTKLNRDVALKVLPEALADDPERLARFRREAQVLAALNHPNIAAIYGLEDSGETYALVLELVEGPTLQDRIAQGAIPLDEALPIAKQIAEALEAAHEQGIIHRDLKPANIKVTPDGVVKVLDFGLAKAIEDVRSAGSSDPASGDAANSPTMSMTAAATRAGFILGTAAYMSPEQARGKPVDKRTDIWAFGVVLYEMLTGRQAFGGSDISETLAAVLRQDMDWADLPAGTPPSVRRLLRRCLTRERANRLPDIAVARLELDDARNEPEASAIAATTPPRLPLWQRPVPLLIGATLLVVVAGLAGWMIREPATSDTVTRFSIPLPPRQQLTNAGRRSLAISPDGTRIVYVANGQLWVRAMDEVDAVPLGGTENSQPASPVFSPDGQWVAFEAGGQLQKVAITGGAPVPVCHAVEPFGISWTVDDSILYAEGIGGIFRVSAAGGAPERIVDLDTTEQVGDPQLLPGGRAVLFTLGTRSFSWDTAQIVVQELGAAGRRTVLIDGGRDARYLPTGHLIYTRGGTLFAVTFDLDDLAVTGAPVPVLEDVRPAPVSSSVNVEFADNGSLVYLSGAANRRRLVWVDREGERSELTGTVDDFQVVRLSPDGDRLAVGIGAGSSAGDIWVYDLARLTRTRLTVDGGNHPLWTPDGKQILYSSAGDNGDLYRMAADGQGTPEQLLARPGRQVPVSWAPGNGGLVFVDSPDGFTSWDIWRLPPNGEPEPVLETEFRETSPAVSPDGAWLAYASDESGTPEVYVQAFPDLGSKQAVSSGGGWMPIWSAGSQEIVYATDEGLVAVPVQTSPTLSLGRARPLVTGVSLGAGPNGFDPHYSLAPDGQRVLLMESGSGEQASSTEIHVVLHWLDELKARVPTP